MKVLVLHGPNLNLLGSRESEIYGATTLAELDQSLIRRGAELGVEVVCAQTNSEGGLVDWIHTAADFDALIINPAAYTHTSIATRDAISAVATPAYEVHISNVYRREEFRHQSFCADVVVGRIIGFGVQGYLLALEGAVKAFETESTTVSCRE